jgi:hypothetical protein
VETGFHNLARSFGHQTLAFEFLSQPIPDTAETVGFIDGMKTGDSCNPVVEDDASLETQVIGILLHGHDNEFFGILNVLGAIYPWQPFPEMDPVPVGQGKKLVALPRVQQLQIKIRFHLNLKHAGLLLMLFQDYLGRKSIKNRLVIMNNINQSTVSKKN